MSLMNPLRHLAARALLGTLLAALLAWTLPPTATAAVQPLDSIVAVVNDDVILRSELDDRLEQIKQQLRAQNTRLPPTDVLRRQVLEQLVMEDIQLQLAKRNNIQIDDEQLNEALTNIAQQNDLDLDTFRRLLERDGISYASFRERIRDQLTIQRLHQQMVGRRIQVSDREIDNLLASESLKSKSNKEYHLRQILLALPEAPGAEEIAAARAKAEQVLADLRNGADFAETAVAVSQGQQALEGGDLGWRDATQLPTLFADQVVDMQPGDIRGPIRSASGFHIIQLEDVRGDERKIVTQTHVRHILLRTDEVTDAAEARRKLRQLRERVEQGEDFAELARAHSQDKLSAADGGDLGWVSPDQLEPSFEEAMQDLAPGEVSPPVETRYGWHIIQVLERRQRDSTEDIKRAQAREILRRRKGEEELQLWLRRIRDQAYVEYRLSS